MFWNGSTAMEGLSGTANAGTGLSSFAGFTAAAGFAAAPSPTCKRIDADRLNDILELLVAEIADREIEPGAHLPVGVLRQADRARLRRSPPISLRY